MSKKKKKHQKNKTFLHSHSSTCQSGFFQLFCTVNSKGEAARTNTCFVYIFIYLFHFCICFHVNANLSGKGKQEYLASQRRVKTVLRAYRDKTNTYGCYGNETRGGESICGLEDSGLCSATPARLFMHFTWVSERVSVRSFVASPASSSSLLLSCHRKPGVIDGAAEVTVAAWRAVSRCAWRPHVRGGSE